jgi:two-component system phosphate regulon sensor histidine kinase PhoR
MDALPVPTIIVDETFIVRHANRPARDVFTALREGGPIALATRAPEFARAIEAVLTDGKTERVLLHERVPVERRLDASLSPLEADGGGVGAVLIVLHDNSERDRLAQMRADFIAHASHELRTPLAALRGFIETLQGPARNDAVARERFLGIMGSESQRMSRLLDDLLSLSRVEMRAHLPPTGEVEIVETVREVIESLAQIAKAQGTEVTLDAAVGNRMIRGDHDEIVQVFVNLIQNAIKYGNKGGHVRVTVSDIRSGASAWVRVAVTDDGPGIAEEHIPRLVERFYRVDDKSSREKGGTGLGLAIVKHVVTRHQGELRIDSRLGVGSTFAVEFPLDESK